ncbi:acyl-CoA N-acyltransferase [Pelagophyceae sp. CCMP2097]|nr:acyl-CoA N-acyltransferase [Pelagophyceae sp. CCMP2097]
MLSARTARVAAAVAAAGGWSLYLLWSRRPARPTTHRLKDGRRVRVRTAEKRDAPAVLDQVKKLAIFEREPVRVVEVTLDQLTKDGWGSPKRFECLLLETLDETGRANAVGFALYYFSYSTWQGTCCYLEDLFIDESCRGSGAGTLMLRSVAGVAANTNCARFHWQALDWNTAAINFYVALGARRMDDWVSLRMGRKALASFVNAAPPQA